MIHKLFVRRSSSVGFNTTGIDDVKYIQCWDEGHKYSMMSRKDAKIVYIRYFTAPFDQGRYAKVGFCSILPSLRNDCTGGSKRP